MSDHDEALAKALVIRAIEPMMRVCDINGEHDRLQKWLEGAEELGVYEGPVKGDIGDLIDAWDHIYYQLAERFPFPEPEPSENESGPKV